MQSMVIAASGSGVGGGGVEDVGEGRSGGAGRGGGKGGGEGGGPRSGASEAVTL